MLLEVEGLRSGYGKTNVLAGISFNVDRGEVVAVIGANGAGKSTTLNSIFGLVRPKSGAVRFEGVDITGRRPGVNVVNGISLTPQGGRVFPRLSVYQNLMLGGYSGDKAELTRRMERVYELFPVLKERGSALAGTLSGGMRQMLAVGMSLMSKPKLMLIDEPSTGLAPVLVTDMLRHLKQVNQELGTTLLIVEQTRQIMTVADRVYCIKLGRIIAEGSPERFMDVEELRKVYLADTDERSLARNEG